MILAGCLHTTGSPTAPATALQKIITWGTAIETGLAEAATTVTGLVTSGAMSGDEGTKIAAILSKVKAADDHLVDVAMKLQQLDATGKASVTSIVTPVIQEIQAEITSGDVVAIKNSAAKATVIVALSGIVATLQLIQGAAT